MWSEKTRTRASAVWRARHRSDRCGARHASPSARGDNLCRAAFHRFRDAHETAGSDGGGIADITTSLGIEGIKVQPRRDLLVADQPNDMIESIQTLLASQPDRERFAHEARHMAEVWYDWGRCLWPLEPLYQDLLAPKAVAC